MHTEDFHKLIKAKSRTIVFLPHCLERLKERTMLQKIAENDILSSSPVVVLEQDYEIKGIRKFRLYYKQDGVNFHTYIITINSDIRFITAWRTSKLRQNDIAKQKFSIKSP